MAALVGCNDSSGSSTNPTRTKSPVTKSKSAGGNFFDDSPATANNDSKTKKIDSGNAARPAPQQEPAEQAKSLALPEIHLSEQHKKSCLLKQGEVLPDFELADIDGKQQKFSELLGDRFTVVCFWSGDVPAAFQQLQDLGPDVVD
ncbi:MAG: peroxiredoxin family protein, partial [Planctomycetales bacterium]